MILFLGCSFTWGQGLWFEKWHEDGISTDVMNKNLPPQFPQEAMGYYDDEIRKKYHYPNLVAKELDRQYVTRWGNGGSNYNIHNCLTNVTNHMIPDGIDLLVVQFTDFMRDAQGDIERLEKNLGKNESNFEYIMSEQINKIDNFCRNTHWYYGDSFQEIPWIGFSWRDDMGKFLKKNYEKNYIPIEYQGKEYEGFVQLENSDLYLNKTIPGCKDYHLNIKGHKLISECILKKINSMDLKFIRPIRN